MCLTNLPFRSGQWSLAGMYTPLITTHENQMHYTTKPTHPYASLLSILSALAPGVGTGSRFRFIQHELNSQWYWDVSLSSLSADRHVASAMKNYPNTQTVYHNWQLQRIQMLSLRIFIYCNIVLRRRRWWVMDQLSRRKASRPTCTG